MTTMTTMTSMTSMTTRAVAMMVAYREAMHVMPKSKVRSHFRASRERAHAIVWEGVVGGGAREPGGRARSRGD